MIAALSNTLDDSEVGYPWVCSGSIYAKGFVYDGDELITGVRLAKLFENVIDKATFRIVVSSLNGFFSVIVELEYSVFCATDIVNSTPIFYCYNDELIVGDNYSYFISNLSGFDDAAVEQYLASGYVYGESTLLIGVKQLLPGSILFVDLKEKRIGVESYYEYLPDSSVDSSQLGLNRVDSLHQVHLKVFKRLVNTLDDRLVILPLSGGYDSRLILEMLKNFNYSNVLCVTWGDKGDWQVSIARDVAQKLGFDWVLIEHKFEEWKEWYDDGGFVSQLSFCGALGSIPYVQENVLIKRLEKDGLLTKDAIFLSGNSGDFIEGEHIPLCEIQDCNKNDVLNRLIYKHLRLNCLISKEKIISYLADEIDDFVSRGYEPGLFFEYWEWKERQSKFVTGCIKPFEENGYEWRMPFWEREIVDFWKNTPISVKQGRLLFYAYAKENMRTELATANPKITKFQTYKERMSDSRYGCYWSKGSWLYAFCNRDSNVFSSDFSKYVKNNNLFLHKINGLVAIDAYTKVFEEIASSCKPSL